MISRQLFEILGISLLGIGVLLVIVRVLIPTLGRPDKVPARSFFETIDKIILFAFVLGLVGIMIYALLQVSDRASAADAKASEATGKLSLLQSTNQLLTE